MMRKKPLKRKTRETIVAWTFMSIWAVGFLAFTMIPIFTSLYYSLSDVILSGEGIIVTFNGFDNYAQVFSSAEGFNFLRSVLDFGIEILFKVPIITVFAIIIAVLLNQKIKGRGFFRAIYFLPVIIASGPVINQLINQGAATIPIVEELGFIQMINDTFSEGLARPIANIFSELIVILWFSGVQILLFIAALQKIDKATYEAAMIDGAGVWESFWKITIPSLTNMVLVSVVFTIINLATFSENEAIQHIKNNMFALETGFGFSSAIAWLYFVVLAVILGVFFLLFRLFTKDRGRR
ncbi:MAG: sugar ABC transporter permease [Candidatus Izemoplasmatales bacterium]